MYRPILEIRAQEDLFSQESLKFLNEELEITYQGKKDKYDFRDCYARINDFYNQEDCWYCEVTPRILHIVTMFDYCAQGLTGLFEAIILNLKPRKFIELNFYADPYKTSCDYYGIPEEKYSLPYYKLSFDGGSVNYENTDEVISNIKGLLGHKEMYVRDEDGNELFLLDITKEKYLYEFI